MERDIIEKGAFCLDAAVKFDYHLLLIGRRHCCSRMMAGH